MKNKLKRKEFIFGFLTESVLYTIKKLTNTEYSFPFEIAMSNQYPQKMVEIRAYNDRVVYVKALEYVFDIKELKLTNLLNLITHNIFIAYSDSSTPETAIKKDTIEEIIRATTYNIDFKEFHEYFLNYLEKRKYIKVDRKNKTIGINLGKLL